MSYTLQLTNQDIETIEFVGYRYGWSNVLGSLEAGTNVIPEHEAWAFNDAFQEDMDGGHSLFPMLDPDSDLYSKLVDFMDSIVKENQAFKHIHVSIGDHCF